MTLPSWHEVPIAKHHDRESFDCGENSLNRFFLHHARKNHQRGAAKTIVAIDNHQGTVLGFYSLSPACIAYDVVPKIAKRRLAHHDVPVFRLARLAVDHRFQGQGLGGQLLLSAGHRALLVAAQVGGVALLIDAKNANIANWYAGYGAVPLVDKPLSLLLPFKTIQNVRNICYLSYSSRLAH